ncbi:hypothetical protein NSQ77_19885 [Oceanobacillus sp. FSL K6-2867]|uniref:hypothetical protein n=1 Tax=Oceanobacillus sp. FSL K6-2867 TaxID=2954748 RepID=UPI0030DD5713
MEDINNKEEREIIKKEVHGNCTLVFYKHPEPIEDKVIGMDLYETLADLLIRQYKSQSHS